ncbi:MAG TPA: ATP-binding protein [Mycobacteriales bacterium]|nr:ATP-binding protein [Mycobacteriales bacterium]
MTSEQEPPPESERRASLPAALTSVRLARQFVRESVAETDHADWSFAAELATSEIVTNAVLHAHTDLDIVLRIGADQMVVEVHDHSPVLPSERRYDDQATTGRGLTLVAAVAVECGVKALGPEGKIVWFSVGDERPGAEPSTWQFESIPIQDEAAVRRVALVKMPVMLWLAARQHHDALLRELVLHQSSYPEVQFDVATADRARNFIMAGVAEAAERDRGSGPSAVDEWPGGDQPAREVDVTLAVPPDIGPDFVVLQQVLDAAERLAVEGRLFVLPGLPEIVAVRDWACDEVVAQLGGMAPQPWAGADQERFTTEIRDRLTAPAAEWDLRLVTEADYGIAAGDDANRIVAVSRSLAALLGWEVADLVGRRVVALVPPRLREAHVAGFSRHLTTGEAKVLGLDLQLPVLRQDGSELMCHFRVERAPVPAGRPIYLAYIEPVVA